MKVGFRERMRITATEEYALRTLRHLARRGPGAVVAASDVAAGEAVTTAHATQVLRRLRAAGFVRSVRGRNGGYRLARPPESIGLGAVLEAVGEHVAGGCETGRYRGQDDWCRHAGGCGMNVLWRALDRLAGAFLSEWTVADLLRPSFEFAADIERRLAAGVDAGHASPVRA